MQIRELRLQRLGLRGIGALERFQDSVDPVGDARQPRREHVEQGRDAGQQEDGRQRHLDDVGDRVECRSATVEAEHQQHCGIGRGRDPRRRGVSGPRFRTFARRTLPEKPSAAGGVSVAIITTRQLPETTCHVVLHWLTEG